MMRSYRHAVGALTDELVSGIDGRARDAWLALGLDGWKPEDLTTARRGVERMLEDDGVVFTSFAPEGEPRRSTPTRWRLDPLPSVVDAEEWAWIDRGTAQRALLLERLVDDLYGTRRTLTSGLVPPELLWRWSGYLRPAWGARPPGRARLVLTGHDVGRGADGGWQVITDRTQAPVGLGLAVENRRVVSRAFPEAFRSTDLRRLSGFVTRVRAALADLAPPGLEDPRIVMLVPERSRGAGFDQAHLASLLGLPLVTGGDLVVEEGRVWTRDVEGVSPVDVILRRVEDQSIDPLELRPDSELGVPGLLSAVRRGSVVLANAPGSGLAESPALAHLLPVLSEALLDEPLRLPSAQSWWCGDPASCSHVVTYLEHLVLRPVDATRGRGVLGAGLSAAQREQWRARIQAEPGAWVGQEILQLSTTPTVSRLAFEPRPMTMRLFAVAREDSYVVMPGALGRCVPDVVDPRTYRRDRPAVSKDVWVLSAAGATTTAGPALTEQLIGRPQLVPMVPRSLENLFWMGRYAERAESLTRQVLALRSLVDEATPHPQDPARRAAEVLAGALDAAAEGALLRGEPPPGTTGEIDLRLQRFFVDPVAAGTVAHTLVALSDCSAAVRDQLSQDVFSVLGGVERACAQLAAALGGDLGTRVRNTGVSVLSGVLALTGITSENMTRDIGWSLLDAGRGLERALQTLLLVRWALERVHPVAVEEALVTTVLTATESVVTHRRRYAGRDDVASLVELVLLDPGNPRSVGYQLRRVRRDLESLPRTTAGTALVTELDEAARLLGSLTAHQLAPAVGRTADEGPDLAREELQRLGVELQARLHSLSEGVAAAYFSQPLAPRRFDDMLPGRRREASG